MSDEAPPFIEQLGDPQLPPPYKYEKLGIRSFPLPADVAALQDLCDKYLNSVVTGRRVRFIPLAGLVYLQVNTYPFMASEVPQFRSMGFLTQDEVTLTLPVVETRCGLPTAIYFFSPYVFVSNDWSLVAGRDILGFPKVLGRFELPHDLSDPYPSRVEVRAFKVLAPTTRLRFERWLSVERDPLADETPGIGDRSRLWPFGPVARLFGPNQHYPLPPEHFALIEGVVSAGEIPLIQLRQFRDPVDWRVASSQALVGCRLTRLRFRNAGFLAPGIVRIEHLGSLPVAGFLGLEGLPGPGGSLIVTPILPTWYQMDATLADTRNLVVRCTELPAAS